MVFLGIINDHDGWEKTRNHRYEVMLRKVNKSNASSLVQESLYEPRLQSSTVKSYNGTLPTQSFYPRESNPASNNFETEECLKSNNGTLHTQSLYPRESNQPSNNLEIGEQMRLPSGSQTSGSNVSGRANQYNFGMTMRYKKNMSQCVQQPYSQGLNPNHSEFGAAEIFNAPGTTSESNYAPSEAMLFKQPLPPRQVNENARLKGRIDVMLLLCREDKVSYDFFLLKKKLWGY